MENPVKVFLTKRDALCYVCQHSNNDCEWFLESAEYLPEYVTDYRQIETNGNLLYIIRGCKKFEPCDNLIMTCKVCGIKFIPKPSDDPKILKNTCYDCWKKMGRLPTAPKPRKKPKERPMLTLICQNCGKKIKTQHPHTKYCSDACKRAANRKQKRKARELKKFREKTMPKMIVEMAVKNLQKQQELQEKEKRKAYMEERKKIREKYELELAKLDIAHNEKIEKERERTATKIDEMRSELKK
jgi:hypothetical protein